MTLSERINAELKAAMKAGEKLRLETLRSLRAALLELEKSGEEVTPEKELSAVMKQAKQRKDSIEQYENGGREDLAQKEREELEIINEFTPKQMTDDEIREEIVGIIEQTEATGMNDFKLVMPRAMGTMKGQADGSRVQAIVREELGKLESE